MEEKEEDVRSGPGLPSKQASTGVHALGPTDGFSRHMKHEFSVEGSMSSEMRQRRVVSESGPASMPLPRRKASQRRRDCEVTAPRVPKMEIESDTGSRESRSPAQKMPLDTASPFSTPVPNNSTRLPTAPVDSNIQALSPRMVQTAGNALSKGSSKTPAARQAAASKKVESESEAPYAATATRTFSSGRLASPEIPPLSNMSSTRAMEQRSPSGFSLTSLLSPTRGMSRKWSHRNRSESTGQLTRKLSQMGSHRSESNDGLSRVGSFRDSLRDRSGSFSSKNAHKVVLTEEEWIEKLSKEEYKVMRERNMEAPFAGKYVYPNPEKCGIYVCKGCQTPLLSTRSQTNSSNGWATFSAPLPKKVETVPSQRAFEGDIFEVLCATCGSFFGLRRTEEGRIEISCLALKFRYVLDEQQEKLLKGKNPGDI